jgi:hypothetical protein
MNAERAPSISFVLGGMTHKEKGSDRYVARCPKLHLSASGSTAKEAEERWSTVLSVFLESCQRRRTLLRVLRKAEIPFALVDPRGNKIRTGDSPEELGGDLSTIIPMIKWGGSTDAGSGQTAP